MSALLVSDLITGGTLVTQNTNIVITKGYAAEDDGGGGTFAWDAVGGTCDGGTIIVPGAAIGVVGPCWRRVYDGAINVRWFGATGDGITDDSTSIQDAFDAAAVDGGEVYFPPGIYIVGTTLSIPTSNPVSIIGAGKFKTIIKLADNADVTVMETKDFDVLYAAVSVNGMTRVVLRDFTIDGNSANNALGHGLRLYGWAYKVENIDIVKCSEHGLWTAWGVDRVGTPDDTAMESKFDHIRSLTNGGKGWLHEGPHDSIMIGYVGAGCSDWGMYVDGNGDGSHMINMNVWNNAGGIYLNKSVYAYNIVSTSNWTIPALFISATAGPCQLTNCTLGVANHGLEIDGSANHTIEASILQCTTTAVSLKNPYNHKIDIVVNDCALGVNFGAGGGASLGNNFVTMRINISPTAVINPNTGLPLYAGAAVATSGEFPFIDKLIVIADGPGAVTYESAIRKLYVTNTISAEYLLAKQTDIGAVGPGTESGLSLQNGATKLYHDASGYLHTNKTIASDTSTMFLNGIAIGFAAAAPVAGTWQAGSIVFNTGVATGQPEGWRCTVTGTPGTWEAMSNHP